MEENIPQAYPVNLTAEYPERSSRWLAFATVVLMVPKLILVIPHIIVTYVLGIAAFVAFVIAQIAVLFTARYPRSLFNFVVGVYRWQMRLNAYILGLTDKYPPFRLDP